MTKTLVGNPEEPEDRGFNMEHGKRDPEDYDYGKKKPSMDLDHAPGGQVHPKPPVAPKQPVPSKAVGHKRGSDQWTQHHMREANKAKKSYYDSLLEK